MDEYRPSVDYPTNYKAKKSRKKEKIHWDVGSNSVVIKDVETNDMRQQEKDTQDLFRYKFPRRFGVKFA
jgi:hypothetical protein